MMTVTVLRYCASGRLVGTMKWRFGASKRLVVAIKSQRTAGRQGRIPRPAFVWPEDGRLGAAVGVSGRLTDKCDLRRADR